MSTRLLSNKFKLIGLFSFTTLLVYGYNKRYNLEELNKMEFTDQKFTEWKKEHPDADPCSIVDEDDEYQYSFRYSQRYDGHKPTLHISQKKGFFDVR